MNKAKQPTIRQLNYLDALYKDPHFKKAAEHCAISQAAFSIAINNLEKILNANLIDRTNKQVVFTALGKKVLEQTRVILREVEKLKKIADGNTTLFSSHLRLGVIPTIAPFVLPSILPKIKSKWAKMQISVYEDLTVNLNQSLLKGELDLLLLALPFDLRGVDTLVLFKDRFKFAYNQKTTFFSPENYRESQLPDDSILLLKDGHCLRDHALSACDVKNSDKVSPYSVSSLHTLVQMVQNDLGVTFMPELAIRGKMLQHTSICTFDMPAHAYRKIGLAWRKGSRQVEEFHQFAETLASLINGH